MIRALRRTPRTTGRSPSCPRSKAPSSRSTRATARCARWSAASTIDKSKFNHVTQAWRQPGSSFKPFIYSAALEKGFTPATVINDAPLFFDAGATGSQPWEPKNYDGKFEGPMPLRTALAKSKNMVSIRILQADRPALRAGLDHALRLRRRQAPGLPDDGAGRRLGDADADGHAPTACSPTAATASTRADRADHRPARATCWSRASRRCSTSRCARIDARNAFMMTSLLQEVTRSGTAASGAGASSSAPTSTARPAPPTTRWTPGSPASSPALVAVVWIGYDKPRKLGDRETGGGLALPVWIDYMEHALQGRAGAGADAARRRGQRRRRVVLRRIRATAPA